jgi:hypothetical protein
LPYVVFALLAAASWNRWIEPYVDTGRELMVPWRVAQGERLYRDVQFPHGPLAPWLGAACDRVFGRSLPARTALAGGIALLALAALERLARGFLAPGRAALATSAAVAAAFFVRPGGWMFPFSVDCAIAVAALTWAVVLIEHGGARWDGAAGFCLLAATVARVEMGLAGVAILGAHVLLARRAPLRLLRLAFFPIASAAIVYGMASYGIPFARLVEDGWLVVIHPPEAFRNVYRAYAGLDAPGLRFAELLLAAAVLAVAGAVLCAAAAAASRLASRSAGAARAVEAAGGIAIAGLALLFFRPPPSLAESLSLVPPLVRVIPPIVVAAAAWRLALRLLRREPLGPLAAVPDAVLWLAALFAVRVLLAAGYAGPYGAFFLPLPLIVCVAGLFATGDRLAATLGPALPRLIAASVAVFLVSRAAAVTVYHREDAGEWSEVRTPVGALWLREPEAGTTRSALAGLAGLFARSGDRDGTLAGFPEAGFFEYALDLRNTFWLEQFFPGRLDAAGEDRAIALLRSRPPEILLYANVLAVGEGQRAFGTDYLRRLDATAREDSTPVAIYGPGARPDARIGDPDFFVELRRVRFIPEKAEKP